MGKQAGSGRRRRIHIPSYPNSASSSSNPGTSSSGQQIITANNLEIHSINENNINDNNNNDSNHDEDLEEETLLRRDYDNAALAVGASKKAATTGAIKKFDAFLKTLIGFEHNLYADAIIKDYNEACRPFITEEVMGKFITYLAEQESLTCFQSGCGILSRVKTELIRVFTKDANKPGLGITTQQWTNLRRRCLVLFKKKSSDHNVRIMLHFIYTNCSWFILGIGVLMLNLVTSVK